jgi:RND family efflux transporter MFP subunit
LETYQNAQTALNLAKSDLEVARFNLRHATIKAPSDGLIMRQLAEEGEIVSSGYPVYLFGSREKKWIVRVNVPDKDIIKIAIGDKAEVLLDPYPDQVFPARVSLIANAADPYTGTYGVEMELSPGTRKMVPGFIAKVKIYTSQYKKLVQIPVESLVEAQERTGYVYQVKNKKPVRKAVRVYEIQKDSLLIEKGVKPGDRLIVKGVNYVKPGVPITPRENSSKTPGENKKSN